jgi:UDP-N-acetylmuramoyl-L-alanyl-D-glutamate--2,6-diaminopimelate ligase
MQLAKLLQAFDIIDLASIDIKGLQNDSRKVSPGDLFFAYPGASCDGRLFITQAIENGAAAIVYEEETNPPFTSTKIPLIPIKNLGQEFAAITNQFYAYPSRNLDITGVTGTNGKTTIAYLLTQAQQLLNRQSAYIGTIGYGTTSNIAPLSNTTPDNLVLQKILFDYHTQGVEMVNMEVSSHALEQHRVDGIHFNQAIFTNLSHEHLDYHKSMEAYALAKAKLFATQDLKSAILNRDDAYYSVMANNVPKTCNILTFGLHGADIQAIDCMLSMKGSAFNIKTPWGMFRVITQLLGKFNIYNCLAVFACLVSQGYTPASVVKIFPSLKASPGRMELVNTSPVILVDYAHSPDAFENALNTLSALKVRSLLVVFGCGGDRDKAKRPIMGKIAQRYADYIIITNDNPRSEEPSEIIAEIKQGMDDSSNIVVIEDRKAAIAKAIELASEDDIVLIAGKGHENYQELGRQRIYFSDQGTVLDLLGKNRAK